MMTQVCSETAALAGRSHLAQSHLFERDCLLPAVLQCTCRPLSRLSLTRTLRVTGNDLDAVGMYLMGVVQLEVDILDNKGPYVVAKAVGIEMSLRSFKSAHDASHWSPVRD